MKWTATKIKQLKGRQNIVCLTAGDYSMARIIDAAGVQLILVGDSLAMTMLGYENTLPVTMVEMLQHAAAVVRGTKEALVVADMPFMSYQASVEQGLANAGRFIKRAGAGAVKIEGGTFRVPLIKALVENGIPVLGHIGLTPQSIKEMGGYKVQGRKNKEAKQLIRDARELEKSGVFSIVLEGVPESLGREITKAVKIPVIGIGAGRYCDGQILVVHDLLGLYSDFTPKFAKRYVDLGAAMKKAFLSYKKEVESGAFPSKEHCY
ncbi:MAG: 3-methyl-2-oxobutanoate hydroxymethyltransferase [Lentisphaerae bacterium RIFOXYA12_FULL_48_11]|nr:MAG: 3-methyl-2-oxobutanoate hydroxymethyltransferase [Lentisphaerae bacterium RIFOXYA12_FULL_48_11]